MPSGDSLSAPPEDLRPRTKHTRFGGVDVRPYRFTAPGYPEPRTSGHYWCSPLSSYVMSSITQFVPTRLVVGDIAEATLVATSTALGLLDSTTGGGGSTASPHLPGRGGGRGDGAVGINSVSPPQVSDAALAILSAGGGSLDGYILQADMSTARDELRTLLPGDEFVTDRGNILLVISKRN